MATRFTTWINTVVSALTGSGLASGDRFPVIDVSGTPATKYITANELKAAFGLIPASSSGATSLDFFEDTDNGTNRVRLQGAASTADVTATLQGVTGTIYVSNGTNPITDSGSLIVATDLDTALQELAAGNGAVNTNATTGATETLTNAPFQAMTMDQNCTFTFPTPTAAGYAFVLYLSGAFTPTFPASVDWASGTPPTYTTPATYVFTTVDTGTNWRGALFGGAGGFA